MQKKKSAVQLAALWKQEDDEQTQAHKRAYGNYLNGMRVGAADDTAKTTETTKTTQAVEKTEASQIAGPQQTKTKIQNDSARPWQGTDKNFGRNTRESPDAPAVPEVVEQLLLPSDPEVPAYWQRNLGQEKTTLLPSDPQLSQYWRQDTGPRLLPQLGRWMGEAFSNAQDYYQTEMKPIMDKVGDAIYSESGLTPEIEAYLSPYEVSGEKSYETLLYPMMTQMEEQRDAFWDNAVETFLDIQQGMKDLPGMPPGDIIDGGQYLGGKFVDSMWGTAEAFLYATQLKIAYEELEKVQAQLQANPGDQQYAAEVDYHQLRVENLLNNPISQLRRHNEESGEALPEGVQLAGQGADLLGSTAKGLGITAGATAATGAAGPSLAAGLNAVEAYFLAYEDAVRQGLPVEEAKKKAWGNVVLSMGADQLVGSFGEYFDWGDVSGEGINTLLHKLLDLALSSSAKGDAEDEDKSDKAAQPGF